MRALFLFSLILITSHPVFAATVEDMCLGEAPDPQKAPAARIFYDSECTQVLAEIMIQRLASKNKAGETEEEAEKDARRENVSSDLTELKKISDLMKSTDQQLTDLTPFTSTSQRYIVDLGYDLGIEVGKEIKTKVEKDLHNVLVVNDFEHAAPWIDTVNMSDVENGLTQIIDSSTAIIDTPPCRVETKPALQPRMTGLEIAAALSTAKVALEAMAAIAGEFQPKLYGMKAVAAPTTLQSSIMAGIENELTLSKVNFLLMPPTVMPQNYIVERADTAASRLKSATTYMEEQSKRLGKNQQFNPTCQGFLVSYLNDASQNLKKYTAPNGNTGSLVERASRKKALIDANINHILQLDAVVSGGSVTGYQRNRFSAIKLIASSDLTLVTRLYTTDSQLKLLLYKSKGCGRAIPLGEFDNEYSEVNCIK